MSNFVHEIVLFRRGKNSVCTKDNVSLCSAPFVWGKELDIMYNNLLNKPQVLNPTIYEMLLQCNHQEKLCIFNSSYLDSQE